MKQKVLAFVKLRWRYILVAIIALIIGGSVGPSQTEVDAATDDNKKLIDQINKLESTNDESTVKIKELEAKVKEAEPFFLLKEEERKEKVAELKKKEAEAKAKKDGSSSS